MAVFHNFPKYRFHESVYFAILCLYLFAFCEDKLKSVLCSLLQHICTNIIQSCLHVNVSKCNVSAVKANLTKQYCILLLPYS